MWLSQYLTEYDEDLSGDSQTDPLGVLTIWSAFGQEIFRNRVNSVSNDVRNYTLNLLHHAVIKDVLDDADTRLSKALDEQSGGRHGLALRQACLVYLENIFTYAMVTAAPETGVDSQGVLGASKARVRLELDGDPFLRFTHKDDGYLLVRQLGLGVSGRYKTPFMQIGFFSDRYNYHHRQEAALLWVKVKEMIEAHPPFCVLFQEARRHLQGFFPRFRAGGGSALGQIPGDLMEAYRRALPNSAQVGADTRDFWLAVTGLNTGAAGTLLRVLDDQARHDPDSRMPIQQLFALAEKNCSEAPERRKLVHVQQVEPLLAQADLLFTLACHRRHQRFAEIETHWHGLGRDAGTLPAAAARIADHPELLEIPSHSGRRRLQRLMCMARQQRFSDQLRSLLDYHAMVMRERGQLPWVQIEQADRIKLNARTKALPAAQDAPMHRWVNTYYIPQFDNLVTGYRGGQA
ncbi:hypothetical protein [Pseudomonas japonica]|uniref:Uncharacterized protein n=1 Tax=Pseudomonas japonica TaxID=256466 RepID=A0A239KU62_9PSED|nr:hypothetical protein [Pseudomonas japonica]SNT21560.1 hypothetical protein SAMN05444352_12927 [Pseudomonas japonica]